MFPRAFQRLHAIAVQSVRACVRDASRENRTVHLRAMNDGSPGTLELHSADMMNEGDYDPIFEV